MQIKFPSNLTNFDWLSNPQLYNFSNLELGRGYTYAFLMENGQKADSLKVGAWCSAFQFIHIYGAIYCNTMNDEYCKDCAIPSVAGSALRLIWYTENVSLMGRTASRYLIPAELCRHVQQKDRKLLTCRYSYT